MYCPAHPPPPPLPLHLFTEIFPRSPVKRLRPAWVGWLIWWCGSKRRALWSAPGLWWPACCSRLLPRSYQRRACCGTSSQRKPSGSGSWRWTSGLVWTGLVGERMNGFDIFTGNIVSELNLVKTNAATFARTMWLGFLLQWAFMRFISLEWPAGGICILQYERTRLGQKQSEK